MAKPTTVSHLFVAVLLATACGVEHGPKATDVGVGLLKDAGAMHTAASNTTASGGDDRHATCSADLDAATGAVDADPFGNAAPRDAALTPATEDGDEPICDGSDTLRLRFSIGSGGLPTEVAAFYGGPFFLIDGNCRYYAMKDPMLGIATDTLSEWAEQELAGDVGWSASETWRDLERGCWDGLVWTLQGPTERLSCPCACPGELAWAEHWATRLASSGERVSQPLTVLAEESAANGDERAWPLDRPIADIEGLVETLVHGSTGVRFEDPTEVELLRELRALAVVAAPGAMGARVIEDDIAYVVYIRDELPDDVAAMLDDWQ